MSDTLDLAASPRPSFARLVKVELRKSVDTRAGFWLLLVTALLTALVMALTILVLALNDVRADFETFVGTTAFTSSVLLPIIGMLLVTGEWGQRTAMVSFTLVPRRSRVIVAKLVAGLVLALGIAVLAFVLAVLANLLYAAFQGSSPNWHLTLGLVVGFLASQAFSMLVGFALATLLLNTPAAIVLYFVVWWMLPIVLTVVGALVDWFGKLEPWIDIKSAQVPMFEGTLHGEQWGHLAVATLLWIVLPVSLGLWRVLRAEVK